MLSANWKRNLFRTTNQSFDQPIGSEHRYPDFAACCGDGNVCGVSVCKAGLKRSMMNGANNGCHWRVGPGMVGFCREREGEKIRNEGRAKKDARKRVSRSTHGRFEEKWSRGKAFAQNRALRRLGTGGHLFCWFACTLSVQMLIDTMHHVEDVDKRVWITAESTGGEGEDVGGKNAQKKPPFVCFGFQID